MPSHAELIKKGSKWLKSQSGAMEGLLASLVEISSWTYDKGGVDAASAVLRAAVPLKYDAIPSPDYGDHTFFYSDAGSKPSSQTKKILLVGHIDTVFPRTKFEGYQSDGKIARGPGVLDMKGGLVVITFALNALEELGILHEIPLAFAVVSDEEVGSPDSTPHLIKLAQGARASLVFESGRSKDAIVTRRKGTGSFTASASGKAAHAGNAHEKGANAIWALARFVDRVQALTDYGRGSTVNVGKILGGIGKNTVPDQAEASVDVRYVVPEELALLKSKIETVAQNLGIEGTQVELKWGAGRNPMTKGLGSEALFAAYSACQKEFGLGGDECHLVGGGSDAATTSGIGVPSIDGLGPRGTGFHTLEEQIELASLLPKAQALMSYLIRHGRQV